MRLRDPEGCRFAAVALGEVMLRLDPGDARIHTARSFTAWEGGGEYNVVRGLRRCFGLPTAIVTALADNAVGRLIEGLMLEGGVDTGFVRWEPYDGIGRDVRNGLNFTERGFGPRGAVGVSDRGHSAASQLRPGTIDWDELHDRCGIRWFHTGGIFAGLSASTAEVAEEAMEAARRHGAVVSYDGNYRPSLWHDRGGRPAAQRLDRRLAAHADVVFGVPVHPGGIDELRRDHPGVEILVGARREVHSANRNDWSAAAWSAEAGLVQASTYAGLEVLDRVGSGDALAAGMIFGLLGGRSLADALELGVAHGALVMTTPGDNSMATLAEVERLVEGAGPTVDR